MEKWGAARTSSPKVRPQMKARHRAPAVTDRSVLRAGWLDGVIADLEANGVNFSTSEQD